MLLARRISFSLRSFRLKIIIFYNSLFVIRFVPLINTWRVRFIGVAKINVWHNDVQFYFICDLIFQWKKNNAWQVHDLPLPGIGHTDTPAVIHLFSIDVSRTILPRYQWFNRNSMEFSIIWFLNFSLFGLNADHI